MGPAHLLAAAAVLGLLVMPVSFAAGGDPAASKSANLRKQIKKLKRRVAALEAKSDQIGQVPASLPASGAAGGDLAGTYPNPTIANGAVTAGKIGDDQVTARQIAGVTTLAATRRLTLNPVSPDQGVDLAVNGSLALRAFCRDLGGGMTEAQVRLFSALDGTRFNYLGGGGGGAPQFGARTNAQLITVNAGDANANTFIATAGTTPGNGFYESAYYDAFATDGSALHGFVVGAANIQVNNQCVFIASGLA